MKNIKLLANLEFANLLTEATQDLQTSAGQSLLGKYQQYLMTNECSYGLVNSFLNEAKNCQFDNAVANLSNAVSNYIQENKYSWQLASTCENLRKVTTSYNYLNRNACNQVEDLLEGKTESEVVKYIKAGALKNVMFCESFRNITQSIFKDVPLFEAKVDYTEITPISLVEKNQGISYFEVSGNIYKIDENEISKASSKEVSNDFLILSQLLESNYINYDNDKFSVQIGNFVYEVCKQGECSKKKCNKEGKCEKCGKDAKSCTCEGEKMTTAQLREHNEMYLNATGRFNKNSNQIAQLLESVAKLTENYNDICVLDNVKVISSNRDNFVVIEHQGKIFTESFTNKWSTNSNALDAVSFIKSKTNIDLNENYKEQIAKIVEQKSVEEKDAILESIHNDEIKARRERIEKLTEEFKNDPVKLAVLSKLAEDLKSLE